MCLHLTKGIVVGIIIAVPSLVQVARQLRALKWMNTEGTVKDYVARRRLGPNDAIYYEASPVYVYSVAGKTLQGDRLSIADTSEDTTQANALSEMQARYPRGSRVRVYYDPRHPEETVLERDVRIIIPTIALLVALVFASSGHPFAC